MSAVAAQTRVELLLTLRRGESLLLTIGIPIVLLLFFSSVDVLPTGDGEPVDFLVPGVLALAVMSTSMVGVGIATGFERQYGVLKRLGATPLGRPALLTAKIAAVVAVELLQFVLLAGTGFLLGWDPEPSVGAAVGAVVLGTIAFTSLGLLMAGTLRAEVTLAAANGLYVVLLLLGGMVFSLDELPGPLRALARALPSGALSDALHGALGPGDVPGRAWIVLVVWAVFAPLAAARWFRWE